MAVDRHARGARRRGGERALRPLREIATPVADLFGPMPYVAMQSLIDPLWGPGAHSYMKAGVPAGARRRGRIDTLVAQHASVTSPKTEIHIQHLGGAVARVPAGATAFASERSAPFLLNIIASTFTARRLHRRGATGRRPRTRRSRRP